MRLLSLNLGQPHTYEWNGEPVETGIFKHAVAGPVALEKLYFAGDGQADLRVHGGPDKAVYAYDTAHYAYWQQELGASWTDWQPGLFGENLTTAGLLETEVRIGDLFGLGTARLRAAQPRFPCFKLNLRFADAEMVRRFSRAGRPGIYFRVEEPGTVQAGDAITRLEAAETSITIAHINDLILQLPAANTPVSEALALPYLAESVKRQLRRRV